jgi:hypothetical protein
MFDEDLNVKSEDDVNEDLESDVVDVSDEEYQLTQAEKGTFCARNRHPSEGGAKGNAANLLPSGMNPFSQCV